jgi:hypothetical protein
MEPTTKEATREEVHRALRLLKTALRLLGFTNREIERRLAYTPSYLTRLFGEQIELRFEHIVDIVHAMGMTVDEFFRFAYPDRLQKLSEPAERLNAMLEEMRPTPPPPDRPGAWGDQEFEEAVVSALRKGLKEQDEQRKKLLDEVAAFERELREIYDSLPPEVRKQIRWPKGLHPPGGRPAKKKPAA